MKRYVGYGIETIFGTQVSPSYYMDVRGVGLETPDQRYIFFPGVGRVSGITAPAPFIPSGDIGAPGELSKLGPFFRSLLGNYGSFATAVAGPVTATLNGNAAVGATNITVDSSAGFAKGDFVQFGTDFVDSEVHKVASVPDSTHVVLAEGLLTARLDNASFKRLALTPVETENGTVTGVETDASAAIDDDAAVFTATIRDGAHRIRVKDATGRILTGFIGADDPDGDNTRVKIYSTSARATQSWAEGGSTGFDFADTPVTYEVFTDGQISVTTHYFSDSQERNPVSLSVSAVKDFNQQDFLGTVINAMNATLAREFLAIDFDALAKSDAQGEPDALPTSAELLTDSYHYADVSSVEYDPEDAGSTLNLLPNMREITVTFSNGIAEDDGIRFGSVSPVEFVHGAIESKFEMMVAFRNRAELEAALLTPQPGKVNIVFARGSDYSLEFQIPRAVMHVIKTPMQQGPMLVTTIGFTANPLTSLDTAFLAVCKNAAYYLYT